MRYADQFTGGTNHVKETLRTIVVARARSGKTILYSELGERVGRPGQGPWPELDVIAAEELAAAIVRRSTCPPIPRIAKGRRCFIPAARCREIRFVACITDCEVVKKQLVGEVLDSQSYAVACTNFCFNLDKEMD